ncbi:MAG: hypothetical protein JXA94_06025 [Parachlamydiales bacterium]|nr:hypothetical protein [Parachlamydiales bacterium]
MNFPKILAVFSLFFLIEGFSNIQEPKIIDPILGYNKSAFINVQKPFGLYTEATFLYLQPTEKSLELGFELPQDDLINNTKGQVINMKFEYKPGFKVGLGLHTLHDGWDGLFEYTYLHMKETTNHKKSSSAKAIIPIFRPSRTPNFSSILEIKNSWKLNFDLFDFLLSKPFFSGKKLIVSPFFGIRSGWINQNFRYETFTDLALSLNNMKSTSWLIGPRLGQNSKWMIEKYFKFFANTSISLTFQQFKTIKLQEENGNTPDILSHSAINRKTNLISPIFDMVLGVGFENFIASNKYHYDLKFGYLLLYLFNQNMISNLKTRLDVDVRTSTKPANLLLQGLDFSFRLDF